MKRHTVLTSVLALSITASLTACSTNQPVTETNKPKVSKKQTTKNKTDKKDRKMVDSSKPSDLESVSKESGVSSNVQSVPVTRYANSGRMQYGIGSTQQNVVVGPKEPVKVVDPEREKKIEALNEAIAKTNKENETLVQLNTDLKQAQELVLSLEADIAEAKASQSQSEQNLDQLQTRLTQANEQVASLKEELKLAQENLSKVISENDVSGQASQLQEEIAQLSNLKEEVLANASENEKNLLQTNGELTQALANLEKNKQDLTKANEQLAEKIKTIQSLSSEMDQLTTSNAQLAERNQAIVEEIQGIKADVASINENLEAKLSEQTNLASEFDKKKEEINQAINELKQNEQTGLIGFLKDQNYEYTDGILEYASSLIDEWKKNPNLAPFVENARLGSAGQRDAINLDNVEEALLYLIQSNDMREADGLSRLSVTHGDMLAAAISADFSRSMNDYNGSIAHRPFLEVNGNKIYAGENLTQFVSDEMGEEENNDPAFYWYNVEKRSLQEIKKWEAETGKTFATLAADEKIAVQKLLAERINNDQTDENTEYYPYHWIQTGHYTNFVSPGNETTGVAVSDGDDGRFDIAVQEYNTTLKLKNEWPESEKFNDKVYLETFRNYRNQLKQELATLQTKLANIDSEKSEKEATLNAEINAIRTSLSDLDTKQKQLETEMSSNQSTIEQQQSKHDELETQKEEASKQQTSLETQISELTSQQSELEQSIQTLRNKVSEYEETKENYSNQVSDLLKQIETKQNELDSIISQSNDAVKQARAQVDSLTEQHEQATKQVETFNNDIQTETNNIATQTQVIETKTAELDQAKEKEKVAQALVDAQENVVQEAQEAENQARAALGQ